MPLSLASTTTTSAYLKMSILTPQLSRRFKVKDQLTPDKANVTLEEERFGHNTLVIVLAVLSNTLLFS